MTSSFTGATTWFVDLALESLLRIPSFFFGATAKIWSPNSDTSSGNPHRDFRYFHSDV